MSAALSAALPFAQKPGSESSLRKTASPSPWTRKSTCGTRGRALSGVISGPPKTILGPPAALIFSQMWRVRSMFQLKTVKPTTSGRRSQIASTSAASAR